MYCLERIHIRTFSSEAYQELKKELCKAESSLSDEGLLEVSILNNINVDGDLVVILKWEKELPQNGSRLAQELTSVLNEYGFYDKTTWEFL
ncbi:hypothetical protein [Maridesulfovibrio sp.]|uniref:hypothetical protein n=1 Tax=unclassified Maridesulfovibrio TaxID=2794999 RepID=UPI003B0044A4